MNRKSLFGRLADSTTVVSKAGRQEYFRVHLEPLEDRKMLATGVFYNDDWINFTDAGNAPADGDIVGHATDFSGDFSTSATGLEYGFDAFGTGDVASPGGEFPLIKDAIDFVTDGEEVHIAEGTHFESDIVLDHALTFVGQGQTETFIFPDIDSTPTTGDFPASTHSGIIIHAAGVTVSDLTLDGAGGISLTGSLNYHHGITTLYDDPVGSTKHNGLLTTMQLGPITAEETNESTPDLEIIRVTVLNTFWHGITISALKDKTFDTGADDAFNLQVFDSTIDNVGDTVKIEENIGILMQNIHDSNEDRFGNVGTSIPTTTIEPLDPGVLGVSIANVGVGVKTSPFSAFPTLTGELGDRNSAHNSAEVTGVAVDNAEFYAFWFIDGDDGNQNAIVATQSTFNPGGGNGSVGIFLDHTRNGGFLGTTTVDGYDIGLRIRNSHADPDSIIPLISAIHMTGPGAGVSGSVGIQIDNDASDRFSGDYENVVIITANVEVSLYETGLLIEQVVAHSDETVVIIDRSKIFDNGTEIFIGDNSVLRGEFSTNTDVVVSGTGTIDPRATNVIGDFFDGSTQPTASPSSNPSPGELLPTKAVTNAAVSITLGPSTTFSPIITGEDAAVDERWDFNDALIYPGVFTPPANFTGSLLAPFQTPYGALFDWSGKVTQDGVSGSVVVGGAATTGELFESFYFIDNTVVNGSIYVLDVEDHTERTFLNIAMKLGPLNEGELIFFGLGDRRANTELYSIPTDLLNSDSFTTVTMSLMAPTIAIDLLTHTEAYDPNLPDEEQDDFGLDMSNISGFTFAGEQGLVFGDTTTPLQFEVDKIFFSDQKSSKLEVSGSIDLGGATLDADIRATFTAAEGEEFTIISNTSASATTTGTFAGLAEGATLAIGGQAFRINYDVGTDSNDVILTTIIGVSVSDTAAPLLEGDAGTVEHVFTVSLSTTNASPVTVEWATANGTAVEPGDYTEASGTLTFAAAGAPQTVTVLANGDTDVELDESFTVVLNSGTVTGAIVADGSGEATITNDDPNISISDSSVSGILEEDAGTVEHVFTVSLSAASTVEITVEFTTVVGTATGGGDDYADAADTLTFAPTETSKLVTVLANGDLTPESDESFTVVLSNPTGGSKILDGSGTGTILDDDTVVSSTIAGRHIFYNDSFFDDPGGGPPTGDPTQNPDDDLAIPTGKSAYIPGAGLAVYANMTNFTKGITGIMIDLDGGGTHASITATDFTLKVGSNNSPSTWAAAPAPTVAVRLGAGDGGSDRVTLTWGTGVIANQWLEVQVLATANTGLASTDVHFWGNRSGDATVFGTEPATQFQTTTSDSATIFGNLSGTPDVDSDHDYNRSGNVTTSDAALVFGALGNLNRLDVPFGGPFAPEPPPASGDGDGSAVASALAAPSSSDGGFDSAWIEASLHSVWVAGRGPAAASSAMLEGDTPRSSALAGVSDELDDAGLDDLFDDLAGG